MDFDLCDNHFFDQARLNIIATYLQECRPETMVRIEAYCFPGATGDPF